MTGADPGFRPGQPFFSRFSPWSPHPPRFAKMTPSMQVGWPCFFLNWFLEGWRPWIRHMHVLCHDAMKVKNIRHNNFIKGFWRQVTSAHKSVLWGNWPLFCFGTVFFPDSWDMSGNHFHSHLFSLGDSIVTQISPEATIVWLDRKNGKWLKRRCYLLNYPPMISRVLYRSGTTRLKLIITPWYLFKLISFSFLVLKTTRWANCWRKVWRITVERRKWLSCTNNALVHECWWSLIHVLACRLCRVCGFQ